MKKLTLTSLLSFTLPFTAYAVAPFQINITVHEVWLSTNTNCTSPIKVIDTGSSGRTSNIVKGPDLGGGTLPPDGTYPCLILVIKDNIQVVPSANGSIAADGGSCVRDTGTPAQHSVCRDDGCVANATIDQKTAKKMDSAIVVVGASTDVTFTLFDPVGLKSNSSGAGCGQSQHASLSIK